MSNERMILCVYIKSVQRSYKHRCRLFNPVKVSFEAENGQVIGYCCRYNELCPFAITVNVINDRLEPVSSSCVTLDVDPPGSTHAHTRLS